MLANVKDHYMRMMVLELEKNGYSWVVINSRGITHKMTTGKPATSLEHSSIMEPLKYILENRSGNVFMIGNSLGGNNLVNVLAENEVKIKAAVLCQPSLDLNAITL